MAVVMMRRDVFLLPLLAAACSGDPAGVRDVEITEDRTLQGLQEEVHVLRTEMNVAHVYAKNPLDLARVQVESICGPAIAVLDG